MRKVEVKFSTDNSAITYNLDIESKKYSVESQSLKDKEVVESNKVEEGSFDDEKSKQDIAKRIYFLVLTGMKDGDRG